MRRCGMRGVVIYRSARKRFEAFLIDRCKGKDANKLRFVVE